MLNRNVKIALTGSAVAVALAGCAGSMTPGPSDAEARAKALELMKAGFNEKGIAKMDRLTQDETQALCSQYAGGAIPKDVAAKIEKANMAAIRPPSDGKYLGDWKRGEQIAQRGTGFQYSDTEKTPVGGNCYACHQLNRAVAVQLRQDPRLHARDAAVRVGQGVEHAGLLGLLVHAALRARGNPHRGAGQGRGRAADGPELAGQPVSPPAVHRRRLLVAFLAVALFAPAAAALSVGDRVEWRDVVLLDGTTLPASRLAGRPVVVELWASWCPFCKNQNPRLQALWREHGGRGLEFVTFSIDKDPAKARAYMAQHGYTFPAAMADAEVLRTFGARKGLPLLYVVGADGRVVQVEASEMFDEDVHALARHARP